MSLNSHGFQRGVGPRGGGSGRFYGGRKPNLAPGADSSAPKAAAELCKFYTRGSCNNGNKCRFSHDVSVAFSIKAHEQPIYSLSALNNPNEPMILSGSADGTIKIWDLKTVSVQHTISTKGKVTHVEINNNLLVCAVDEPVAGIDETITAGVVYVYAIPDFQPIPVYRSEEMPFTHPFGEIRSFALFFHDAAKVIVTGGGEGTVRTWKFDPARNKFEPLSVLEGHVRGVTSVLLHDQFLWTGSLDHSIRVWEVVSGRCLGILSSANNGKGHTGPVSCLILTPAGPNNEVHIASGGVDKEMKLWKANGEFVYSGPHGAEITALCHFQDENKGIPVLLVGLATGSIAIRSCLSMQLIYVIESHFLNTRTIWSIVNLGQSCFAAAGEDGMIVTWKVDRPITEPTST